MESVRVIAASVSTFALKHVPSRGRIADSVYLTSQIAMPVVGFVTSIIAARFLSPYELGVIQTILLVTTYCSFLHFGVFNGLNRNIAFYEGRNDTAKIQAMVDASFTTAVFVGGFGVIVSGGVLMYVISHGYPSLYAYAVAAVFGMLVFSPIATHYETVYRSSRAFMPLGCYLHGRNGLNLLLGTLPAVMGAAGHIFRSATMPVVDALLLSRRVPRKAIARGRLAEVTELIRVGFPMLITGLLFTLFGAADRTIAALTLGPGAVGELALSGMIVAAIQAVPLSISALLYPKAAYIFGQSESSAALKRFFLAALAVNVVTILPVCLLGYFLIGPLTERFLPDYVSGVPAARIYVLGSMFMVYFGASVIIPVVRRNGPLIGAYIAGVALLWGLGLILVQRGYGIEGIAWARLLAGGFLCLFSLSYSYYLTAADIRN